MNLSTDDIDSIWGAAIKLAQAGNPAKFEQIVEQVKKARLSLIDDKSQAKAAIVDKAIADIRQLDE